MARKYQLHGAFPSKAGDSAYQVAQKNGFEGTEQEWLASLVGKTGPQGPAGKDASEEVILYTPQNLTEEQKAQARENIGAIETPKTAEVGQTIVVKEVDENGKPIQWESADLPTGGAKLVYELVTTEQVDTIEFELDASQREKLRNTKSYISIFLKSADNVTTSDTDDGKLVVNLGYGTNVTIDSVSPTGNVGHRQHTNLGLLIDTTVFSIYETAQMCLLERVDVDRGTSRTMDYKHMRLAPFAFVTYDSGVTVKLTPNYPMGTGTTVRIYALGTKGVIA